MTIRCGRCGLWVAFLIHLAIVAALLPRAVHWDGIGFLERAQGGGRDLAHFLHAPAIRAACRVAGPFGASPETAAKFLSAIGASVAFALLGRRFEKQGLARGSALACAALVTSTPLFWRQAGVIEPSTWAIASLLLAAAASDEYANAPTWGRLCGACAALLLAIGFHVLSALALPWLTFLAMSGGDRPPLRHALVPLGVGALGAGLIALAPRGEMERFAMFCAGFLSQPRGLREACSLLSANLLELGRMVREGALILAAVGLAGLALVIARRDRIVPAAAWLATPHLLAFAILGKPKVALVLPVFVALGIAAAAGAAVRERNERVRRAGACALLLLLVVQVGFALPEVIRRAITPDEKCAEALRLAAALPESSVFMAGPVALHVRWYTEAPVIVLPELLHFAKSAQGRALDPGLVIREEAARHSASGRSVYVTLEALKYLQREWSTEPAELLEGNVEVIRIPDDPGSALILVARGRS